MAGYIAPQTTQTTLANGDYPRIGYVAVGQIQGFAIGANVSLGFGSTIGTYQICDIQPGMLGVRAVYPGTPHLNAVNYGLTSVSQFPAGTLVTQVPQFIYAPAGSGVRGNAKPKPPPPVALQILKPVPTGGQVGVGVLFADTGQSITDTRASVKACYTSADTSTVNILGNNTVAVEPSGILVETAHTNLMLRSQELDNAAWTLQGAGGGIAPVVTPNVAIAPDGTLTADQVDFFATSAGQTSGIFQSIATTAGAYGLSMWIKGVGGTSGAIKWLQFDGSLKPAMDAPFTSSWNRVKLTQTLNTSLSSATEIGFSDAFSGGSGGPASVYIWGVQFQASRFTSSYVPTTSATATGAADVIRVSTTGFPTTSGSLTLTYTPLWSTGGRPASNDQVLFDSGEGTANGITLDVEGDILLAFVGGNVIVPASPSTWTKGTAYKCTFTWGNGTVTISRDGTVLKQSTGLTINVVHNTTACIGSQGGTQQAEGNIDNIIITP